MIEIKPKNKYAVVMTARDMIEGANAFINGLDYYDNEVDFYLLGGKKKVAYMEKVNQAHGLKVNVQMISMVDCLNEWPKPPEKRGGWEVRFYRYIFAKHLRDSYDAVLIVDADMLCLNNIMKYFKIAHDTGFLILPNNPWGGTVEKVKEFGIEFMKGAASPPFHCMPLFFDPKVHADFLGAVWEAGRVEDWGDMTLVNRTIFRRKLEDRVLPLPNNLWVQTSWYFSKIKRTKRGEKFYLLSMEEKINTVHRRWWMANVCDRFIGDIKEADNLAKGRHNVRLFWDEYKRLNTEHKIKIDFPLERPQSLK